MKITLIHGDHQTRSRERYYKIMDTVKARGWEVVHLNAGEISALDSLTTASMFSDNQLYVLEDLDKIPAHEIKWLQNNADRLESNLLIWHKKELGQKLIKSLPKNTSVEVFKLPKIIFSFLEDMRPRRSKEALKKLQILKNTEPLEFVLALVASSLRDMMIVKSGGTLAYPSWRASKIKSQADSFNEDRLKSLIQALAKADIDAKTGGIGLETSLDLILLSHLE